MSEDPQPSRSAKARPIRDTLALILRIIAYIHIYAVMAVVVVACIAHIVMAPTVWTGTRDVLAWYSPLNLLNYGLLIVALLPGIALFVLAGWCHNEDD